MKKIIALLLASVIAFSFTGAASSGKTDTALNVSSDNIAYEISDSLYGLFIEDISYACDGGLVSNLINNNSFEYPFDSLYAWNIESENYFVSDEGGINGKNGQYLSVSVNGGAKIQNIGYPELYDYKTYDYNEKKATTPDMGFKRGEKYAFSAYFKNVDFKGAIVASLDARGNSQKYRFDIDNCNEWTKIDLVLTADATADGAFLLTAEGSGTFCMDFVSLVPVNSYGYDSEQWKYVSLRSDLYEALKQLSPSFIRFPGGCLAEGDSLENLFSWKNTIGPLEEREQTYNLWRDDNNGRRYINTNSMGYHEYFTLCADLGAEPIPVLNVGLTCQGRNGYGEMRDKYKNGAITETDWQEYLKTIALTPGTAEWEQYAKDILDLIEYANGDVSTEWGAKRAENGHPEPFNMKYIALGNENWGEVYWRNFDELYNMVKEKYPDITVVTTSGAWLEGEDFDYAWITANSKYRDTIVDEHYYTVGSYLFNNTHRYDSYERSGAKVFVGEYAPKSDGVGTLMTKNNIWAAVESAAYLTGIERNGDVVKMISYAPTFAKVNAQCWDVNMIWFDSQQVVYTPDYFVQMLFANNYGTHYITTDFDKTEDGIYSSVTVDKDEEVIYVKLVNSSGKNQTVDINLEGFENAKNPTVQYMSETFKAACNETGERIKVAPAQKALSIKNNSVKYEMGGLSASVIRIPYGNNDGSGLYTLPDFGIIMPYIHPVIEIAVPCVFGLVVVCAAATVFALKYKNSHKRKQKDK